MTIEYRTLDYADTDEIRRYLVSFYAIPAGVDEYHFAKDDAFIEQCIATARAQENASNTFAGIALDARAIVGLHILRRFEEGPRVGVHIAGLWVAEPHRRGGIARRLKQDGEAWARAIGADFINTNVRSGNLRMLEINARLGFEPYRIQLRKRL